MVKIGDRYTHLVPTSLLYSLHMLRNRQSSVLAPNGLTLIDEIYTFSRMPVPLKSLYVFNNDTKKYLFGELTETLSH